MKITVTHKDTTIIIDEIDNDQEDKTSIKPQGTHNNELIKETIKIIVDQIQKLNK